MRTLDSLSILKNFLNLVNLRRNILIHPSLCHNSIGHPFSFHLLETQEKTLKRILITFTVQHDKGVENTGKSIIRYPISYRCVATHTDGQDSTRCDFMNLFNSYYYFHILCSDTKLFTYRDHNQDDIALSECKHCT